jgi:hypothetical protein
VFIAPFNLIELLLLVAPFEWWMSEKAYARLNDRVMAVLYSPVIMITAVLETRRAHRVRLNKRRGGEEDDDDNVIEEWEQDKVRELQDFETDGWAKKVEDSRPNVEFDSATRECMELRKEVEELKGMLKQLLKVNEVGAGEVDGQTQTNG